LGQRTLKCVLSIGTRSAQSIRASGTSAASTGRTRDRTRPMLQQRQKVLAKAPSTRDPKQTSLRCFAFLLPNVAEWVGRKAGMWSFECRTRFPGDLPDTAESWRRCSVESPPPKALDTMAHLERAPHSHSGLQRSRE